MKNKRTKRFFVSVLVSSLIPLIIVVTIASILFIIYQHNISFSELLIRGELLAKQAAHMAEKPLLENSHYDLIDVFEAMASEKDVIHVYVMDNDGNIIESSNHKRRDGKSPHRLIKEFTWERLDSNRIIHFLFPVLGGVKGFVCVELSAQRMYAGQITMIRMMGVFMIIFIFLAFFVAYINTRSIIKPIKQLSHTFHVIAGGNPDAPIDTSRPDELGDLARSFALLRDTISDNMSKIKTYRDNLEKLVQDRTIELSVALNDLKTTQDQLILSEKMAALGQLIAGIAHEINTPLGAIQSSIGSISKTLDKTLVQLPSFLDELSPESKEFFEIIIKKAVNDNYTLTSREERKIKKALAIQLEKVHINNSMEIADTIVDMKIYKDIEVLIPYLQREENIRVLKMAYKISSLHRNTHIISTAADRASRVIFALKKFSRFDSTAKKMKTMITEGIETVLTLYSNQIKNGVEVVRHYNPVPEIFCYPDELNQVWINIIQNALYAMDYKGTLVIDLSVKGNYVVVAISDSGKGIPGSAMGKIFEPFYTTKARGEGSGLGLDIVRKIIERHNGNIEVKCEFDKTVFSIFLPLNEV